MAEIEFVPFARYCPQDRDRRFVPLPNPLQQIPIRQPQNPKARGSGQLGDIDIKTESGDTINVALYVEDGYLTGLDVLCEFGFKPVPNTWREVARYVNAAR